MLTYEMLINHVQCNREVEFFYGGKKYSITQNSKGWYLTEYNNPVYQTCDDGETLIKYGQIQGKYLSDIWPDVEIDIIF